MQKNHSHSNKQRSFGDEALKAQQLRFEQRYDELLSQLHQTRADRDHLDTQYTQAQLSYRTAVRRCHHLRSSNLVLKRRLTNAQRTLRLKQEAIAALLPYYPHALPAELLRKIELA